MGQAGHMVPRRTQGKRGRGLAGGKRGREPAGLEPQAPAGSPSLSPRRRTETGGSAGNCRPLVVSAGAAGPGRGWRPRDPGPGSAQAGMEGLEMKQRRKREGIGKMKEEREGRRGGCGAGP